MPRGQGRHRHLLRRERKYFERAIAVPSDDDGCAEVEGRVGLAWQKQDRAGKAGKKESASEPATHEDEGIVDLIQHTPREVKAIMSKRVFDAFMRGDDDSCRRQIKALNSLMMAGYFRLRHDWGGDA